MLLTMNEARESLRVDGTDNDEIIKALMEAIPSYMEAATGKNWDSGSNPHPLAQAAAKFILQLWFDPQTPDSERLKRTIDNLLTSLTVIGRSQNG